MRSDRVAWFAAMWAALTVPLLALFALSVPAVHARKLTPLPAVQVGLDELGLPVAWYAAWWTGVLLAFAVVCFTAAGLIVARRPRERAAWFAALFLITLGAANAPNMEALVWQRPALEGAATLAFQLLVTCLVLFLFTFPDGRFQPGWSRAVVVAVVTGLRCSGPCCSRSSAASPPRSTATGRSPHRSSASRRGGSRSGWPSRWGHS
jgi:hypothetical protein